MLCLSTKSTLPDQTDQYKTIGQLESKMIAIMVWVQPLVLAMFYRTDSLDVKSTVHLVRTEVDIVCRFSLRLCIASFQVQRLLSHHFISNLTLIHFLVSQQNFMNANIQVFSGKKFIIFKLWLKKSHTHKLCETCLKVCTQRETLQHGASLKMKYGDWSPTLRDERKSNSASVCRPWVKRQRCTNMISTLFPTAQWKKVERIEGFHHWQS